jgi:C4-dicarboxylate transporter
MTMDAAGGLGATITPAMAMVIAVAGGAENRFCPAT